MEKKALFIIAALLILVGCGTNPLDVNISDVKAPELKLQRLDQDFFKLNGQNFEEQTRVLQAKYGVYYEHYLMNFLARRGTADSGYKSSVLAYLNDYDVRTAHRYSEALYPAGFESELLPQLNDCVKRFRYHFPTRKLPARLVTCASGWNYAFAYMDSNLVVALDMYLGDTAIHYKMLRYPQYQVRKMNRHYMLHDIVRGWMLSEFDNAEAGSTLLSHTIFYGKLFYAVQALLPKSHDSLIIGYTGKQLDYCRSYEKNLWGYFAEKNRLYENNMNTVRELTGDGPFTGVISKECPPRIAMWVGLQIVRSYMKNNKSVSLNDLMNERDAQKVLNSSKYRP